MKKILFIILIIPTILYANEILSNKTDSKGIWKQERQDSGVVVGILKDISPSYKLELDNKPKLSTKDMYNISIILKSGKQLIIGRMEDLTSDDISELETKGFESELVKN